MIVYSLKMYITFTNGEEKSRTMTFNDAMAFVGETELELAA